MRNPAKNDPDRMTVSLAKKIIGIDLSDLNLNARELKYVAAYCSNGFKSSEAARQAGYSSNRKEFSGAYASEMNRRPKIAEAVKRFVDSVLGPYKLKLEYEVLDVYYKRAFYTVDKFYATNAAGDTNLIPLEQIPDEWKCCIDGVETRSTGGMNPILWNEYKLANRDTALQTLLKMVQLTSDDDTKFLPQEYRARAQLVFQKHLSDQSSLKSSLMSLGVVQQQRDVTPRGES